MIQLSQVGWGSYDKFEGPFYGGRIKFDTPSNHDFSDKVLRVVTTTEGGHVDAVNMYDSCILTVGVIQWCEKIFAFSKALGYCAQQGNSDQINNVLATAPKPLEFKQNQTGTWRFYFKDGEEINSPSLMKDAFFGGASGLKGEWADEQKLFAKQVAMCMANLWDSQSCQKSQVEFAKKSLMNFVFAKTRTSLFMTKEEDGYIGALKAAYISYAANLPAVADKFYTKASSDPRWDSYSQYDRFCLALKSIIFEPRIGIWPHRYEVIKPVLQKHFGVIIPSLSDIQLYKYKHDATITLSPKEVQEKLISLGYDLGPYGADGVIGKKTVAAIKEFQSTRDLVSTGILDEATCEALSNS